MATKTNKANKQNSQVAEKNAVVRSANSFAVESNVPVPSIKRSSTWEFLGSMQVGDSFLITGEDMNLKARQAYQSALKTHKVKLVTRKVTENGVEGIRIWRVASE